MTIYILDRSKDTEHLITNKDTGKPVSLYTEVFDTGAESHAFGLFGGTSEQIAFALYYDHTQDKDLSIEKSKELSRNLNVIVPEIIEFDSSNLV